MVSDTQRCSAIAPNFRQAKEIAKPIELSPAGTTIEERKAVYNPHATARKIIATTNLTDPEVIADLILSETCDDDLRDAYRSILRGVVTETMRQMNMNARAGVTTPQAPTKSAKVAAIQAYHVTYFDQRVRVGESYKMLGDCTISEVLELAETRRAIAAKNEAVASEYESLAERMRRTGASIVRDLGVAVAA